MNDFSPPGSTGNSDAPNPSESTPAGWYDDPWEPGSQRWWDGAAWTASTVRPNPGQQGAPGTDWQGDSPGTAGADGRLSEISEWLGIVFRTAIGRAGHLLPIMMVTVLPSAFLTALFAWLTVRGARVNNLSCVLFEEQDPDCLTFSGFSGNYVIPLVLAIIWWLLGTAVFHLATGHQLYGALDDDKPSWATSLRAGLRGLPRFLLYGIGILVVMALAYGISIAVGAAAGAVAVAIIGLLWIPLAVFLWVKLSFLTVAAAVAPPKTNLLSASSSVSDGRFPAIFGRLLLLVLLSIAVLIGSQAFSFPLGLIVGPGINEGLAEDIITEDRSPESFAIADLITNPSSLAISMVLINTLTSSIVAALQTAGTAALYRETGGPRRDGPDPVAPAPAASF